MSDLSYLQLCTVISNLLLQLCVRSAASIVSDFTTTVVSDLHLKKAMRCPFPVILDLSPLKELPYFAIRVTSI